MRVCCRGKFSEAGDNDGHILICETLRFGPETGLHAPRLLEVSYACALFSGRVWGLVSPANFLEPSGEGKGKPSTFQPNHPKP